MMLMGALPFQRFHRLFFCGSPPRETKRKATILGGPLKKATPSGCCVSLCVFHLDPWFLWANATQQATPPNRQAEWRGFQPDLKGFLAVRRSCFGKPGTRGQRYCLRKARAEVGPRSATLPGQGRKLLGKPTSVKKGSLEGHPLASIPTLAAGSRVAAHFGSVSLEV